MAIPLKVMIVRHGEKPTVKHQAPFGVTESGEQDFESLTVRGWTRAGGLIGLFDPEREPLRDALATPTLIYASRPRDPAVAVSDSDQGSRSKRPSQTVAPLAARLGITPDLTFGKGDEAALATRVLQQQGPVLISWQHEAISTIAQQIVGSRPPAGGFPAKWPGARFDLVWVLDQPAEDGQPWRFTQVPQRLLSGDSDTVIT
jgi:hypothetical protein